MVNSGSFDSDGQGDRNAKAGLTQPHSASDSTQSSSPVTASVATSCKTGFSQTADSGLPSVAHAIEPTPTKTEFNCDMPVENFTNLSSVDGEVEESAKSQATDERTSLCCSLPLEKIQGVLTSYHPPLPKPDDDGAKTAKQPARKLLCLYCDRSFVNANLRQKHVERIHSVKQNRRVSSRRQNQLTVTPCVYCDKLNGSDNTLKDLFQHLINEHSSKYFGCLPCEDRFLTSSLLFDHNAIVHQSSTLQNTNIEASANPEKTTLKTPVLDNVKISEQFEDIPVKITRSKVKPKPEDGSKIKKSTVGNKKSTKLKELRSKKLSVKSSKIALKRRESKRLQAIAKMTDTQKKKKQPKPVEKKNSNPGKTEQINSTKSTEKLKTNLNSINPYPEFDHFYRVKKITDHSIDNLKISSLTFDDVFDKAFFNRIRCNIEENLLHHIDGKLFKNEESESRISNFEKISNVPQEIQNSNSENYGCELSLNAVTPVASLSLNSQFGEDFESQIEYGSKPSKKRTQPRKDEIHYKYFTRRKYQASILEHKENRDLSKLDMWTQLVIKKRQQKMLDDKKSAKEILEYSSCDEYKNKLKREELNRILDRRGPFEDLKEEATKKAALDKLNSASQDNISEETFTEVREVLNDILNRVFATTDELSVCVEATAEETSISNVKKEDMREIPVYLNLRRSSSLPSDGEIDKSDKIALICSSQETENFELPTNQVRRKNELIELTGEWARCRMYICAACGAKLPNMRYLLDHKSLYHQNVWVQHYEFVGNQSELYRHLSIPTLGKVGAVEDSVQCKLWKRSDARVCTKCGKQCNALGELHRHLLECGGDWTWMLARKKCKYRPFGAKSRRKRRGLVTRIHNKQKTEPTEKKTYKKTFEGPRQRPSDADTIQRMLANLPAKRSTRKLISLQDGIYRARSTKQNVKQNRVKCGKVIYKSSSRKETTEKTVNTTPSKSKSQINSSSNRRSLRNLNKVLASRILDSNASLNVKRKIKALHERRRTRQSLVEQENKEIINDENVEQSSLTDSVSPSKLKSNSSNKESLEPKDTEQPVKRTSPRSSPKNLKKKMSVKKLLTGKLNIKSFFPVKKKKNRKILSENQNPQDIENTEVENADIKTRSKRKSTEPSEEEKKVETPQVKTDQKKSRSETFNTLIRSLSMKKKKVIKKSVQEKTKEASDIINTNQKNVIEKPEDEKKDVKLQPTQQLDKSSKKRKLKRSFRNVINKVKKLKIDNVPEKTEDIKLTQKNQEGPFLEESNPEGSSVRVQVEKIIIPSISEAKESTSDISTIADIEINFHDNNENPPIPETIFKLELNNEKSLQAKGELDFDTQPINTNINKIDDNIAEINTNIEILDKENDTDIEKIDKTQPISIETSVKPKIVPLISPNMKGKIRKPTRGLNDCIAMLTNKLQQKTVEENFTKKESKFGLLSPNKAPSLFSCPPKIDCILRIPTYRSQITYPEIEETALDLSAKSSRNKEIIPFAKSLDEFDKNSFMKANIAEINNRNLFVPMFDRKLNKTFNSIDEIIEDVVENRIHTIFPEIKERKWSSVDDIIQKVINDHHITSNLKLPTRNTIDEIIDYVVESGVGTINCKTNEIKDNNTQNVITVRKIGSVRKPKNKKLHEITKTGESIDSDVPKVVATIPKEPLDNIYPRIELDIQTSIENLTEINNGYLKKKSKKSDHNKQVMESKEVDSSTVETANVQGVAEDKINVGAEENILKNNETIENSCTDSVAKVELNNAFIDTSTMEEKTCQSPVKVKKGTRKLGQVRNRSQTKKTTVAKTKISEKILIETNIDDQLTVKEVRSNPVLEYNANQSVGSENLMSKNEEIKLLCNEDEAHLLENKLMTYQEKPNTFSSDSEDDIPLAALVKSDDKIKYKNVTSPSCIEEVINKQTYKDSTENNPGRKNKILSKEKVYANNKDSSNTVIQMCDEKSANILQDSITSTTVPDNSKRKIRSKSFVKRNMKNQFDNTETTINVTVPDKKESQLNANITIKESVISEELSEKTKEIVNTSEEQNNSSGSLKNECKDYSLSECSIEKELKPVKTNVSNNINMMKENLFEPSEIENSTKIISESSKQNVNSELNGNSPKLICSIENNINIESAIENNRTTSSCTTKNLKSRAKETTKLHLSNSPLNNTLQDSTSEATTEETKSILTSSDVISLKTKNKNPKSSNKSNTMLVNSNAIVDNEVALDSKELNKAFIPKSVMEDSEDRISNDLKAERYQNEGELKKALITPNHKIASNEPEIQNHFEIKSKAIARSSKKKNGKKYFEPDILLGKMSDINDSITNGEHPKKNKKRNIPKEIKEISSKHHGDMENINYIFEKVANTVLQVANDYNKEMAVKDGISREMLSKTTKINDEISPVTSQLEILEDIPLKHIVDEVKQPVLKNLEVTLKLADITKSGFPISNSKNNISEEESDKTDELCRDFIEPQAKVKKKRQSRFANKSNSLNYLDSDENNYAISISKSDRIGDVQSAKYKKPKPQLLKNKSTEITTNVSLTVAITEERADDKKGKLRSKSKHIVSTKDKKENEDLSIYDKTEIAFKNFDSKTSSNESNDTSIENNSLQKVKNNRQSVKNKKTKGINNKVPRTNKNNFEFENESIGINNVEQSLLPAPDLLPDSTNCEIIKFCEALSKENSSETISEKASEEPPIKIIINKQKTRRKSKSFKKIDLKGQNDLFEDFALVIKKPKRLASIITFTSPDMFSKENYPNCFKKPLITNEHVETDETPVELDSSVEEMDMELDEIPITSNIIERNTESFLLPAANTFTNTDVEAFVETLDELESRKQNDEESDNKEKNISIEELFLPEEYSMLPIGTEEEEESLYQTNNRRSTRNKNNTNKQDNDSENPKFKTDPRNRNKILDDSYETVQDLTKFDTISENISEKIKNNVPQTSKEPAMEDMDDKPGSSVIENMISNSKKIEEKINEVKLVSKKIRKSKNKNTNTATEHEDVHTKLNIPIQELSTTPKSNKNKRKRSKSTTIHEFSSIDAVHEISIELPQNLDSLINEIGAESQKLKDADSIYAFTESEDLEIERPIEKPKKTPRKQTKSLSESTDASRESLTNTESLPVATIYNITDAQQTPKDIKSDENSDLKETSNIAKKKSGNLNSEHILTAEIKENDVETLEVRRKSVRSAKVKALEHIHDDALAELTESERNRRSEKDKNNTTEESITTEEVNKKRTNRRRSRSQKSQKLFEESKLPSDSSLTNNVLVDNQMHQEHAGENSYRSESEDGLLKNNSGENINNDDKDLIAILEREANGIDQVQENKDNVACLIKNSNNKKTKKTQKAKKSVNAPVSIKDTDRALQLEDIVADLTPEELDERIEEGLCNGTENREESEKNKPIQLEHHEKSINESSIPENEVNSLLTEDNNQELRRSRRGSRKIASYNENDLIDPLLDDIDGKKKIRKKEKVVLEELENKNQKKLKESERKLNSDELFDLLKASSNENSNNVQKTNSYKEDIQNTFDNLLQKSSTLDQNGTSDKNKKEKSIYDFTDSPENTEQQDNLLPLVSGREQNNVHKLEPVKTQVEENSNSASLNTAVLEANNMITSISVLELSVDDSKSKSLKSDKTNSGNKLIYCEICNKKFIRTENLIKHKRTLTHIQKLSELEAKEAAQKSQSHHSTNSIIDITSDSSKAGENVYKNDINIHDILQESDKPNRNEPTIEHTSFPNNHSLKLADIINDVLNKPVLEGDNDKHNFSDIILQNNADMQTEYRRYKSLGERKSFESEPVERPAVRLPEPYVSKTTILEKQISLLENIIENQTTGVNYIDDISMSSNNSLDNNALVSPSEVSLKQDDSNTFSRINLTKPNVNDESFLKPSQYEEISEDSVNLRSYEDQKLRKTLNRDEELFLECCSLLKSGSELSSYSNKKSHNKILNTMGLKQCDEPEWLERKSLVEKPLYDVGNEYSDNSRIPTPLGDSYDDDASNSNTISSNWDMNKKVNVFEDISQDRQDDVNKSFSFQEILNEEGEEEKKSKSISKFGEILSKTIGALPKMIKRTVLEEAFSEKKQEDLSDGSTSEGRKIITKGARKVFEGLKVSIPTEELNLEEVLNCSPKSKKIDIVNIQNSNELAVEGSPTAKPSRNARKSKPVKNKSKLGSNLLFKMKKNKISSPASPKKKNEDDVKSHDIYDFEETQDNTDVFTKPDFRTFRNMKTSETVPEQESDTDSRDYIDSFSYEAPSITSSISSSSSKKPKTQENITKKKCMIMGRIFKNAAKSKIEDIDEEIRDIPPLNNGELLENYVADCKKIIKNEEVAKPKLTEKEINQLFDELLENKPTPQESKNVEPKNGVKPKPDVKKTDAKKKVKPKNKKRSRTNSDSTDDEFSLNKTGKKRAYRKNAKAEDNCINLEQELKECIGVASRKSQRKCTSGKQNVLVEYWSSDDSQFEALLESQRIEVKQPSKIENTNLVEPEPVPQEADIITDNSPVEPVRVTVLDTLGKHKPKDTEKKPQQKRKLSGEKKVKPYVPCTEKTSDTITSNRRKRAAVNPLYHWSSSSEDESQDLIEVKPIRDELEDEDRPVQHGWIVGDSPKKLVTMLAQAKGKKTDIDCVKEQGKKRTNAIS